MSKTKTNTFGFGRRVWIIITILVLVFSGGYAYYTYQYQPPQETSDEPELQTATVRRGDLIIYASGTGTLIPANEASFGFETSGQVVEISVNVGDQVEAGQVLARLEDKSAVNDLATAQREYLELISQTAIVSARQQVAEIEETVTTTRSTLAYLVSPTVLLWEERVSETENALKQIKDEGATDEKITEAEQALKLAQINLNYANNNYYSYLVEYFAETETVGSRGGTYEAVVKDEDGNPVINYPTELQISLARSEYELAQAQLQEARWYLSALQGEQIPENATGSNLVKLENIRIDLENAQSNVEATQLISPISGTVMSLDFSIGDKVGTTAIASVADLSTPYLEIFLDETDWDKIAVGYPVEVIFDVVEEKTYTGTVTQVDPGLSAQQNTNYVRALVALDTLQTSLNLPIGAGAAVDVIGGRAENALLVPVDALRETSPGQYAVFVIENDRPKLRVIEIGLKDLFYAEVLSGLEPGDVVSTGLVETE